MDWPFRLSTASQVIMFGPFLSTSDGVTVVTSAIAAADIQLEKHNNTGTVSKNSGGATYVANGYYQATFDATDTNTVGRLKIMFNITSQACLPVWKDMVVLTSTVFDALYGSTSVLPIDIVRVAGSSTAAFNMSSAALSTIGGTAVSTVSLPTVSTIPAVMEIAMTADGQLQNRQLIFDRGTATSGLREQAAQISTWTAATSTFVVSPPFSVTPVHGDTFRVF